MLDPQNYKGSYKTIAGELCLDFANTMSWRGYDREFDWLHSYNNYVDWGLLVGQITNQDMQELKEKGSRNPKKADEVLQKAIGLRESINRIFFAFSQSLKPDASDIENLNNYLPESLFHLRIFAKNDEYRWGWENDSGPSLDQITWRIVWSAANLLLSDKLKRIGNCKACDWLFIDTSRNHSRRWCTMEDCGNREKVRRYRKRN